MSNINCVIIQLHYIEIGVTNLLTLYTFVSSINNYLLIFCKTYPSIISKWWSGMQQWSTLHCAIPVTDNWIAIFQWHGQSTLTACLHSDHSYIQHFAFSMQFITTSLISFTIIRFFWTLLLLVTFQQEK